MRNHGAPHHTVKDAVDLVHAYALFAPKPVHLALQINIGDGKTKVQNRKGLVYFPNPLSRQKVLVLAEGEAAEEAQRSGATIVGGMELFDRLIKGELVYEHCITTPQFYKKMDHLGKHMREKYPHPRRGTVTDEIADTIQKLSGGQGFEVSQEGELRMRVALTDFTSEQMVKNIVAVLETVHKLKHEKVAGKKHWVKASIISKELLNVPLDINDALGI